MRFKSLVTLILTICLAVITSNALAKSNKSGKSDKSDKSAKHSEKSAKSDKSDKSAKSRKNGKGKGHCKSEKSGKGHKKKRGRGHNRDCGDDNPEPPVLVCLADVEEIIREEERFDAETLESLGFFTVSISYEGQICAIGDEVVYQDDVVTDGGATRCEFNTAQSSLSARMESETEFWYDMTVTLNCDDEGTPNN